MAAAVMSGERAPGQRPDCPHAPHEGACGPTHRGACAWEHPEGSCGAVQPACPACKAIRRSMHVPAVAARVREDGVANMTCPECERRSMSFDAELICGTCGWLVPDVNARLAERWAASGGELPGWPGACPGCGNFGAPLHPLRFPLICPGCGQAGDMAQERVSPTAGLAVVCGNRGCGFRIMIPPSIFCPDCKQNLRPLAKINELIKAENQFELG